MGATARRSIHANNSGEFDGPTKDENESRRRRSVGFGRENAAKERKPIGQGERKLEPSDGYMVGLFRAHGRDDGPLDWQARGFPAGFGCRHRLGGHGSAVSL